MRNNLKFKTVDDEKLEYVKEAITNLQEFIKYKNN